MGYLLKYAPTPKFTNIAIRFRNKSFRMTETSFSTEWNHHGQWWYGKRCRYYWKWIQEKNETEKEEKNENPTYLYNIIHIAYNVAVWRKTCNVYDGIAPVQFTRKNRTLHCSYRAICVIFHINMHNWKDSFIAIHVFCRMKLFFLGSLVLVYSSCNVKVGKPIFLEIVQLD